MYGCVKSFLSNVDIFACSAIWLPSYHTWKLTWHHKCAWSWIWFPRHHELEFFSSILKSFFSAPSAMYGCFKSVSSNVHIFAWSAIWLPSYHKLHIWLGYGCQERFMVVNPGVHLLPAVKQLYI